MMPNYEEHGGHLECKLDEIIRLLHKLNRKVSRLGSSQDFTKEDSLVKDMTEKIREAKARVQHRVPPITNKKGK